MSQVDRKYDPIRARVRQAYDSQNLDEVPFLVSCLNSSDSDGGPKIPLLAAWVLGRWGLDVSGEQLTRLAISDDPVVRSSVAYALGETGDQRSLGLLESLLKDPVDEVANWSALALSKLGDVAVPSLANQLTVEDGHLPRAGYIADALHKIDSEEARQCLRGELHRLDATRSASLLAFVGLDDL